MYPHDIFYGDGGENTRIIVQNVVADSTADFLAEAQSREVRSLVAYEIAMIDIAQAMGTLLGQGRVIWEASDID